MTASAVHSILPPLSPEEERHSETATQVIRDRIAAAGGWLPFDQYVELALYAPGIGYYSAGSAKIGAEGDFVTAPEVSDLFTRCVARQCADVLAETGGEILELGAGTGRMAFTLLQSLGDLDALPERYAILEVSGDLAERQRTRLQQLPARLRERVIWLDRLPEIPMRGVMLGNEVLDALPFKRFVVRDGLPREMGVGMQESHIVWRESEATANDVGQLPFADLSAELLGGLPDGYTSEACLRVGPWLAGVSQCLEQGLLLLFDYGFPRSHYYHPQRTDGTLRCYFKHRAHNDPFINIAVQDITAWVDFTRVAEAALDAGLEVAGFATQAAFLLGTGIEALIATATDPVQRTRFAGEARRLLMPGEMGEAFKVMALRRTLEQPLRGFAHQDLRGSL